MLQSCTTIVFNSPSPDLKWHVNHCRFYPNTMAILEKIVKSEKAKLLRIKFNFFYGYYQLVQTIMTESSCVGNLDIIVEHGDPKIIPLLRQQQPFPTAYYPCTSIRLISDTYSLEQNRDIIESIPHWTPRVKKLFLHLASYDRPSRPYLRTELVQAVGKNLHLQSVELYVDNVKYNDEETKNADEECRASLERYCERNKKLHATLDEADSIPLNVKKNSSLFYMLSHVPLLK